MAVPSNLPYNPPVKLDQPYYIPCPLSSKDCIELQDRTRLAKHIFKCLCPSTARVGYVAPIRYRGQYKCAWRVQYYLNVSHRFSRNKLFEHICLNQPQNARIAKRLPIGAPPQQELHYALVNCNCVPNENLSIIDVEFNPNDVLAEGFNGFHLDDE